MNIKILGSGTCAVTRRRSTSCVLLKLGNQTLLVDIGFGSIRRLSESNVDYADIDMILCTHFHLDHIGDLCPLLMALQFTPGLQRKKPLTLIGPPGFAEFLIRCRDLYGDWIISNDAFKIKIVEPEHFPIQKGLIQTKQVHHSNNSVGYRIEYNNKIIAFSGDSGPCENLVTICSEADIAFLECSFPDEQPNEYHLTPSQAADIARKARVKKLVLTHFYPQMDNLNIIELCEKIFFGEIVIAEDLLTIEIN